MVVIHNLFQKEEMKNWKKKSKQLKWLKVESVPLNNN